MQQAAVQAQDELNAANAQWSVAWANLAVARLQASAASQTLQVFDENTFTPQVWRAMGNFILQIYQRYMDMALQTARMMQKAYNFENDASVTFIKNAYPGLVDGLLAADSLMVDIQSFTSDLLISTRSKKQLVKTSISLANRYSYQFETQLRKTGTMNFETSLDDFDTVFPGTYQGRIRRVTVDIQGIIPPSGISGSLSNGGISFYRLPSDTATGSKDRNIRIQSAETLVLSDYNPSLDGVTNSTNNNQTGIFEGAGVASSWQLSLPRALNDIDYSTLTDVVLTFLYETRYDPQLTAPVLTQLASRPGFYTRQRAVPLAWLYPDLFFAFKSSGKLTLTLTAGDFPFNQTAPIVNAVSLLVATSPVSKASGITLSLGLPGQTVAAGVTDTTGAISSQKSGSPWSALTGKSALGDWTITLSVAANPTLAPQGKLDLSALLNLVLVVDYTFTPRS
jgi:hypothetical protein